MTQNLLGALRKYLPFQADAANSACTGRIFIVGDSHATAFERALDSQDARDSYPAVTVYRLAKEKGDASIGNIDEAKFFKLAKKLTPADFIFSVFGGNQYAAFSTIRSTREFEFLLSPADRDVSSDAIDLIPSRIMEAYLEAGLQQAVVRKLEHLRAISRAQVCHLASPPPKEDNDFIAKHFEERFQELGMEEFGPCRPELRRKSWQLQQRILKRDCGRIGVRYVPPPGQVFTSTGYLDPRYFAKDVTHANRRYGRAVLKQIMQIAAPAEPESRGGDLYESAPTP
jgi:hypothetical protein